MPELVSSPEEDDYFLMETTNKIQTILTNLFLRFTKTTVLGHHGPRTLLG